MKSFEYYEPKTLGEAVDILASGEEIRILAGGCGLLILMKEKLFFPRAIVNIKRVPGLKYIESENGEVRIGTLSTHNEVKDSPVVQEKIPMLAEALRYVATDRIRNMATLGGTLAHADPSSDAAPALLALGSRVRVLGKKGEREIPLESFFRDYFETALEPSDVLKEIIVPIPPDGAGGTYTRFQVRKAMDRAMPGVAVLIDLEDDGKTTRLARIAFSGVGNTCIRLQRAEEFLEGKEDHPDIRKRIGSMLKETIDPVEEYHFSSEYKKKMAGIFLQRAFAEAYGR
ncbi:MAG: FAD binding domain-containing protein, partial [Candidatus Binatia bacterium]